MVLGDLGKPETGIFVGRGDSGSVTVVIKYQTCLIFKLTPTDPNRFKQTVRDSTFSGNRFTKYLNWEP